MCHREQVQVVITEHALCRIAKPHQRFKHASRVLTAIHHVAQNIERVAAWREINLAKEALECVVAALDVANQVKCHL